MSRPTHAASVVNAAYATDVTTSAACTLQVGGVVFTVACEPYLESEYGNDWVGEAPIKLLLTSVSADSFSAPLQVSGVVFTVACESYLGSEYGNDWVGEAPKLLLLSLLLLPLPPLLLLLLLLPVCHRSVAWFLTLRVSPTWKASTAMTKWVLLTALSAAVAAAPCLS
jgi:hypothetical protein